MTSSALPKTQFYQGREEYKWGEQAEELIKGGEGVAGLLGGVLGRGAGAGVTWQPPQAAAA